MAKALPSLPDAGRVNPPAESALDAPAINAAPLPTPENTPLPGGGRWRWSDAMPGWVDADAPDSATLTPKE